MRQYSGFALDYSSLRSNIGGLAPRDKFTNDCPANLDPEKDLGCACWMAKHKYGGFMGPFAMLPQDEKPDVV